MAGYDEVEIFDTLSANPDTFYVTADGLHLYLKVDDGLLRFDVAEGNFNDLDEAGLNQFIQESLAQLTE
jgi:hypothetical protein